jgi:hypothetical protein
VQQYDGSVCEEQETLSAITVREKELPHDIIHSCFG